MDKDLQVLVLVIVIAPNGHHRGGDDEVDDQKEVRQSIDAWMPFFK